MKSSLKAFFERTVLFNTLAGKNPSQDPDSEQFHKDMLNQIHRVQEELNELKAAVETLQATAQNLKPLEGIEYLPFIQSYAQLGQIEKAVELTQKTIEKTASTREMFCQFWSDRLAENVQISQNQVSPVYNTEDCPAFFE